MAKIRINERINNPTDIESLLSDVGGVVYSRHRREMSVGCDDCRFIGTKECCLQLISIFCDESLKIRLFFV